MRESYPRSIINNINNNDLRKNEHHFNLTLQSQLWHHLFLDAFGEHGHTCAVRIGCGSCRLSFRSRKPRHLVGYPLLHVGCRRRRLHQLLSGMVVGKTCHLAFCRFQTGKALHALTREDREKRSLLQQSWHGGHHHRAPHSRHSPPHLHSCRIGKDALLEVHALHNHRCGGMELHIGYHGVVSPHHRARRPTA